MIRRSCLVYDRSGYFLFVAEALAKQFTSVFYYSEWRGMSPTSVKRLVGVGLYPVVRENNLFDTLDAVDLVVFPDCGNADFQDHLRQQGKQVWGMGRPEMLETNKIFFHNWLLGTSLPVPDMWNISGIDALKDFMEGQDNVFLKGNDRGDFETYFHRNWDLSEPWYNELAHRLGPYKDEIQIIAQSKVEGVEVGFDGFVVKNRILSPTCFGFECKDAGYIGKFVEELDLPQPLRDVNNEILKWMESLGFEPSGQFSTEVRISPDLQGYFIDPTMRCPSPPGECLLKNIENLGEIIWNGVNGRKTLVKNKSTYVAQIQMLSSWADEHFMSLKFPEEYREQISIRFHYIHDFLDYIAPAIPDLPGLPVVSACGYGESMEEAFDDAKKVAEKIEAYDLSWNEGVFEKLEKTVKEFTDLGYSF